MLCSRYLELPWGPCAAPWSPAGLAVGELTMVAEGHWVENACGEALIFSPEVWHRLTPLGIHQAWRRVFQVKHGLQTCFCLGW